jgi:hypothetical protein
MTTIVGRNVKLEVALTFSAAKTVTAVTVSALGSPGVATSTAHAMSNGTVGFWSVTGGMPQLDGQASRVYNQAANTFELQGLYTGVFLPFTAGTFTPAATWGTLSEMTDYDSGGGSASDLDDTKSSDVITQLIPGLLAADSMKISLKNQTFNSAVMQFIEDTAIAQAYQVYRITLNDGSVRVFRGIPSRPSESMKLGQLATGSFDIKTKGFVLKGAA